MSARLLGFRRILSVLHRLITQTGSNLSLMVSNVLGIWVPFLLGNHWSQSVVEFTVSNYVRTKTKELSIQ
jgi:hypothetical protein